MPIYTGMMILMQFVIVLISKEIFWIVWEIDYLGNPSSEKCHITLHLEILKTVVEVNDYKEIALLHGRK